MKILLTTAFAIALSTPMLSAAPVEKVLMNQVTAKMQPFDRCINCLQQVDAGFEPDGWIVHVWNRTSSARLFLGDSPEGGGRAFGIINFDRDVAGQIFYGLRGDTIPLQAGRSYRLTFSYFTEGAAKGGLACRLTDRKRNNSVAYEVEHGEVDGVESISLSDNDLVFRMLENLDQWRACSIDLKVITGSLLMQLYFMNDSSGEDNALYFKDIKLVEFPKDTVPPPLTPIKGEAKPETPIEPSANPAPISGATQ